MNIWSAAGSVLAVVLLPAVAGWATPLPPGGEQLYRTHCAKCHGADGGKGKAGKNNLQLSVVSGEAIRWQVSEGKKGMPSFKKKLSPEDIAAVSDYVISLRK